MQNSYTNKSIKSKTTKIFIGIFLCLFSLSLMINVGYIARILAFPFLFLFGVIGYFLFALTFVQGLMLIIKRRFYIFTKWYRRTAFIIFVIAVSMLATLITQQCLNDFQGIDQSVNNFVKQIDINYLESKTVNVFNGRYYGGGFLGSLLIGLTNSINPICSYCIVVAIIIISLCFYFSNIIFSKNIVHDETKKKEKGNNIDTIVIGKTDDSVENITYKQNDGSLANDSSVTNVCLEEPTFTNKSFDAQESFTEVGNIEQSLVKEDEMSNFDQPILNENYNLETNNTSHLSNFRRNSHNDFQLAYLNHNENILVQSTSRMQPINETNQGSVQETNNLNQNTADFFTNEDEIISENFSDNYSNGSDDCAQETNDKLNKNILAPGSTEISENDQKDSIESIDNNNFINPIDINKIEKQVEKSMNEKSIKLENEPRPRVNWIPPSSDLLEKIELQGVVEKNAEIAEKRKETINGILKDFKVGAECVSYIIGPSVTRYNIKYESNVSSRTLGNCIQDIGIRLGGVPIRFEPMVQGEVFSGLEIANIETTTVSFKEIFDGLPDVKKHPLSVGFGKGISGEITYADFNKFPHLLVAGCTGSGKSIYVNSLITTLIMRNSPDDLKLVLVDPKYVEMTKYSDMPHLLCPIINEASKAKVMLSKLVDEMNHRYSFMNEADGATDIDGYNEWALNNGKQTVPYIIVVLDEYADLVDTCKEISGPVAILAQKARAAGIHLLIATQRPSTNVITGVIKGNLPTHVALMTSSSVDSITIIGEGGAEKLLGRGDMLVQSPLVSRVGLVRLQGCYIQNKEMVRIVNYLKEHYETHYDENYLDLEEHSKDEGANSLKNGEYNAKGASEEEKYQAIKEWVMGEEMMSMSKIQRTCNVGFNRAGRIFDRLKEEGIVAKEVESSRGARVLVHDKFYESDDTDVVTSSEQIR